MASEFDSPVTLPQLLALKQRWRVAMRSLVNTGALVGAISPRHRVSLFQRLNKEYGGKAEPVLFPAERPRGLMQLAEMRFGKPLPVDKAATELGLPAERLTGILDGYQPGMTALPEGVVPFRPRRR